MPTARQIVESLPSEAREFLVVAAEVGRPSADRSAQLLGREARTALLGHELVRRTRDGRRIELTDAAAGVAQEALRLSRPEARMVDVEQRVRPSGAEPGHRLVRTPGG